jgi:membrane protease YdiL (CAAX protease family)
MNDRNANDGQLFLRWVGVMIGMVFPTIVTLTYFVFGDQVDPDGQQIRYVVMKCLQFAFPLVWALAVLRDRLPWTIVSRRGWATGTGFGAAVMLAMVGGYWLAFRDTPLFTVAADGVQQKLLGMGIDSTAKYIAVGVFYSLIHSALEEYYWRWFVFGQLERVMPWWPAVAVSALAFTAHHIVVLAAYFGWTSGMMWLLCLGITLGGAFWAWLYHRTGSLLGPWLGHLLVDAGIFLVGFDLGTRGLAG